MFPPAPQIADRILLFKSLGISFILTAYLHFQEELEHFGKTVLPLVRKLEAEGRGLEVLVAGAGGAAHLPGMLAAHTVLPVLGVPVQNKALNGLDSLISIVQMPGGVPVGTLAIVPSGARNAWLLAASIVGLSRPDVRDRLRAWRQARTDEVLDDPDPRTPAP